MHDYKINSSGDESKLCEIDYVDSGETSCEMTILGMFHKGNDSLINK